MAMSKHLLFGPSDRYLNTTFTTDERHAIVAGKHERLNKTFVFVPKPIWLAILDFANLLDIFITDTCVKAELSNKVSAAIVKAMVEKMLYYVVFKQGKGKAGEDLTSVLGHGFTGNKSVLLPESALSALLIVNDYFRDFKDVAEEAMHRFSAALPKQFERITRALAPAPAPAPAPITPVNGPCSPVDSCSSLGDRIRHMVPCGTSQSQSQSPEQQVLAYAAAQIRVSCDDMNRMRERFDAANAKLEYLNMLKACMAVERESTELARQLVLDRAQAQA